MMQIIYVVMELNYPEPWRKEKSNHVLLIELMERHEYISFF
jgi:hypothetical protein